MKNEEIGSKEPSNSAPQPSSQDTMADFNYENLTLSVTEMLKAGVHFGHKKSRWNPKMKPFIFGERNGVHIIDLEKTLSLFEKTLEYIRMTVANGGKIIFIGTKPQAKKIIEKASKAVGMPFVSNRWLGGTFTNFEQMKKRIKYLNEQERKLAGGEFSKYTKYEQGRIKKEIAKMNEKMGGLKKLERLPQAIIVADMKENESALKEAKKVGVAIIALADTNIDPNLADFLIPANDDALSSIRYVIGIIAKSIKETKVLPKADSNEKNNMKKNQPRTNQKKS